MQMNYCRRCGQKLTLKNNNLYLCENQHPIFLNSAPSTGVFIIDNQHNVTFSVRGIEPNKGMLDAFGGFLDGAETVEDGLKRELKEELGLSENDYSEPVYLCSGLGKYNYKGETMPVISMLHYITLNSGVNLQPQDDVADTATFPLHEVPLDRLHDQDIVAGIQALQRLLG